MNQVKNAVLQALLEGVLTDLMVKTNVYNVYVDDVTTLAEKLAEVIASLNSKVTADEVKAEIRFYVEEAILGGAW